MKKIILYIILGLCILGIIPLALSLTNTSGGGGNSPSVITGQTYTLTKNSDEHSTIVVYDSESNSVSSLKSGQEYTISVSVDERYDLSTLTLNGISIENNSIFVPTSNITIISTSSLEPYSLTKTGDNCTISVLNSNNENVFSLIDGQTYTILVLPPAGFGFVSISSISVNGTIVDYSSYGVNGYIATFIAVEDTIIFVDVDYCACCVSGDTLISMFDGTQKRADEVVVGDKILSYNFETGEIEEDIVDEQVIRYRNNQVTLTFTDGTEIKITNDHQLYSEFGWKCYDYQSGIKTYGDVIEVCEDELSVGDKLFCLNKMFDKEIANISVEYAEDENSLFTMYTFCVHNNHNYFSADLLSHNTTPCP